MLKPTQPKWARPTNGRASIHHSTLRLTLLALLLTCGFWPTAFAAKGTKAKAGVAAVAFNTFTGTGDWTSTSNWSANAIPTLFDSAIIAPGAVVTVTVNQTRVGSLLVSPGATLNIVGHLQLWVTKTLNNQGQILTPGFTEGGIIMSGGGTHLAVVMGNKLSINTFGVDRNTRLLTDMDIHVGAATLAGNFDLNNRVFTLKATAQHSAYFSSNLFSFPILPTMTNAANFTVEHYLSPNLVSGTGAWVLVGTPNDGQTVSAWSANNPYATATYNQATTTNGSVWKLDPRSTTPGMGGYKKPASANESAPIGTGYRVWFWNSPFFTTGGAIWKTKGPVNMFSHTFNLLHCAGANCANGGSSIENGWNLIANPFPARLDWDASFGWTRSHIYNATYIRNHKANNTASYVNGVGVNGGSRYINRGQGFLIWVDSAIASLSVNHFAINEPTLNVARQGAVSDVLKLNINSNSNGNLQDQIAIRWDAAATNGFDGNLEARKLTSATGINLSFLNGTAPMAILAEALPTSTTTYPLALSTPQAGTYTISFEGLASLSNPQWSIYLLDNQTGISTQVTETATYSFSATSGDNNGRFSLVVNPAGVTSLGNTISNKLLLSPNPATSVVTLQLAHAISQPTTFRISNAVGQVVMSATIPANRTELSLDLSNLAKGVYMVQAPGFGVSKLVKE